VQTEGGAILRLAPEHERTLATDQTQTAAWLVPEREQQGLRRYLETIRERWKLILLAVVVTTAAAALYVALADRTYRATSQLLVTPVANDISALTGLGLIPQSNDPTRDVETASQLATTIDVARIARRKLRTDRSASSLLGDVTATPVAQSNVVVITASSTSAAFAQRLADAFGEAVVQDRTTKLHRQLDSLIANIEPRLRSSPAGAKAPLGKRLAELETLRAGGDPTMRLDTRAQLPDHASTPRPKLSIAAGIVAGLMLGLGGAFAANVLDPRLRREEQLRARYRLPVLARIPDEGRSHGGAIAPQQLSPAGVEAFRTLRANVTSVGASAGAGKAVIVTGSSRADGKTTTALNLGAALALAGKRAILIEADLRHPSIGPALGLGPGPGIASVLLEDAPLQDALVASDAYGDNLRLLLADRAGEWMADQFSLPRARALVEEARQMADYVIIDTPPLTAVVDALPLVRLADEVLIVARLGKTDLGRLDRLGELLAQHGVTPLGLVLVGVHRSREYAYYGSSGDGGVPTLQPRPREREPLLRTP
jgi:capsular exopolysaccharide synthesis family protein